MTVAPEIILETVAAYKEHGSARKAAKELGVGKTTVTDRLKRAAEIGLLGYAPVLPGYAVKSIASKADDGSWVKQTKAPGAQFELPAGQIVKGVSALVDQDGREVLKWVKTGADVSVSEATIRAVVDELKAELPRVAPTPAPMRVVDDLLNQFTVTDSHFGMLAWSEETGGDDYDLRIAEKLLLDWFSAAVALAPAAHTAVFAQLGDLMHHDALESVTPAHGHVLDADSRLQKMIRVVIRTVRRIIDMLLAKHQHVHVIMAAGNHDPASSAWMRELLAAMYEGEPRVSVDNSPSLYYAYEWGKTALFFHHGHKRAPSNVDTVFAAQFRELFGRTTHAYAHVGHRHSDELRSGNLMKVEQHETLAARDSYAAGGGWLAGRSAKVITYSKRGGEVFRHIMSPEMIAANDNADLTEEAA